jgi:hypothetical protein
MGRELRDRYADMADVAADLRRVQAGKSPLGPRGVSRRAWTGLKGGFRPAYALGAAAVLGAAVGTAWYYSSSGSATFALPGTGEKASASPEREPEPLSFPAVAGLAIGAEGFPIYVAEAESSVVLRIGSHGLSEPVAGQPEVHGFGNGPGVAARFSLLRGLALGPQGDLFASDGFVIRKVGKDGRVSTLAGVGGKPDQLDGVKGQFRLPSGLAVDAAGNVYVADLYTIRRIAPDGTVRTLAGANGHAGGSDGQGSGATFSDRPKALAVDGAGNLWVADTSNDTIRRISPAGRVVTVAGAVRSAGTDDGPAPKARFSHPGGIAILGTGYAPGAIYIADTDNHVIRKLTLIRSGTASEPDIPFGEVTTVAGTAGEPGSSDGEARSARFDRPESLALDAAGDLYIADTGNHRLRVLRSDGRVGTVR